MAVATPQASLRVVIAGFDLGVADAIPLELQLRNAYLRVLNRLVREAAARLARTAITASAIPDPMHKAATWHLPNEDEVLPAAEVQKQLLAATQPIRVKIVSHMMGGALASAGVGFDVTNPLAQDVLGQMGKRITDISNFTRASIMASLQTSHAAGLSIPHAAREMAKTVGATNKTRATLIARTEFIGAQNASSLASVAYTGAATSKVWLATNDARTRPDHADASGQSVPLSEPFDVGGNPMQHPGDQNAPAEEVCNCRCTMTYESDEQEPASGGIDLASLAGETATEALDAQAFDAQAFTAFEKAHPAGSHRNLYKGVTSTSGGHKQGLVKILSHDPLFGTKVEDVATGKTIHLEPTHSLKVPKPQAPPKIASPATSPLIPQAHATPPIAEQAKSNMQLIVEHEFPVGMKVDSDYGEIEVTGHTPGGNIEIHNLATGGHSTISPGEFEDITVPKAPAHPAGEESISAQGVSVGSQLTTKLYGDEVDVTVTKVEGDIVTYDVTSGPYAGFPGQGSKAAFEKELGHAPAPKAAPKPPKAPITTPDLKPAAPTEPFEVKAGHAVKFDSAYDPEHPYGSPGAKPVPGGDGIVINVDYRTNQVMVQKADGEIAQTHMSKITNELTGQKADWQVGGGKPHKPTTYTPPEQAHAFATTKQEYLPPPKKLTSVLDEHAYSRALAHHEYADSLDPGALSAVRDYTGSAYGQLNRSLRASKGRTVPAMAKQMDKAFKEIPPTKVNGILYRGTNLSNVESAQNLRVGQVIHDDGFVSTTTDPSSIFSGDKLIIEVPKGSKVLDVNATSGSMHASEREVLLNRGARFLVTKIEHGAGYNRVLHVRLLLPKEYAKVTDTPPG